MGHPIVWTALMCITAFSANTIEGRQNCDRVDFSCDFNNPCDPLCEEGQAYYTGTSIRAYVECSGENLEICTELKCPSKHYWNKHSETCERRVQDCEAKRFTCDYNNPCRTLCTEGQHVYPGKWPNKYIECIGNNYGMCKERTCPRKHFWNKRKESCELRTQDCSLGRFSCDYNNPCKPICDPEQTVYPAVRLNNYIECTGDLLQQCNTRKCPKKHYWDKDTESCKPVSQDCNSGAFSCDYNNPCTPLCDESQMLYPGNWPRNYIECSGPNFGTCTRLKCPRREVFDPETLECVPNK